MTLNIQLPAEYRNAVRGLIRKHADFEAFRLAHGAFASRDFTHTLIMSAIETLGLEQEVRDMLSRPAPAPERGDRERVDVPYTTDGSNDDLEVRIVTPEQDAAGAMMASVIEPLSPFLAPTIIDRVRGALAPIVDMALKPAVEKIVTKTVVVNEEGLPAEPASFGTSIATRGTKTTMGKLYGINSRNKFAGLPVQLWANGDGCPALDPYYVAEPSTLARLVSACERGRNTWLAGPSGSGKSTMPEQYAARTGRPFVRIGFQRAIEPTDLLGMKEPNGKGGMRWVDGVLTKAVRTPGTVIMLDEITSAPAGLLMVLQTLLDMRFLTLSTGERVPCAEGVVFVCGDNTRGFGDTTGLYAGTMQANAALVDRMARMVIVDYLPASLEAEALANHTAAPRPACDRVVAFVGSARKLPGFEDRPLSLRRMVAFVEMVQDGFSISDAFEDTFLSRMPDAERSALGMHWKAAFDGAAFEAEMSGGPLPAPASDAPEQVKARSIFDAYDGN